MVLYNNIIYGYERVLDIIYLLTELYTTSVISELPHRLTYINDNNNNHNKDKTMTTFDEKPSDFVVLLEQEFLNYIFFVNITCTYILL